MHLLVANLNYQKLLLLLLPLFLLISCGPSKVIKSSDVQEKRINAPDAVALDNFEEGVMLMKQAKYKAAAVKFKTALRKDSYFLDAAYNLGNCYQQLKKWNKAKRAYRKVFSLDSTNRPSRLAYAKTLIAEGDLSAADSFYQQILKQNPRDDIVLANLIDVKRRQKKYKLAKELARKTLEENPENMAAIVNLGLVYMDQRKNNVAKMIFQRVLREQPKNAQAHNNLGLIYLADGDSAKAIDSFRLASRYDKNLRQPQMNLAEIYLKYKNYKGAGAIYRRLLAKDSDNVKARVNLGYALMGQKQYSKARQQLALAYRKNSKNPQLNFNLGVLYHQHLNNRSKAVRYYRRFVSLRGISISRNHIVFNYLRELSQTKGSATGSSSMAPLPPLTKPKKLNKIGK